MYLICHVGFKRRVVDVMYIGSLTFVISKYQKCVLEFLTIHQPKVIVLGAAIVSCIRLKEYINEVSYSYVLFDEHILSVLFGFNPTFRIRVMTFYV
jgi:hypothetical protein